MSRLQLLKERADAVAERARKVAEKAEAENRGLTDDELAEHRKSMQELGEILEAVKAAKADEAVMQKAREFATEVGVPGAPAAAKDSGWCLPFGKATAAGIADKMIGATQFGAKALAPSGSAVFAQEFTADPVALGKPANSLLAVLPVKVHGQPEFAYLR